MKRLYLTENSDEKAKEMDIFLSILQLNWGCLFTKAQRKVDERRQEQLRRPQQLPVEEDVEKIKTFIGNELERLLEDQYMILGQYEFNRLRAICVSRLTLFNARRGGEPARLLLKEWQDAEIGSWVDPQPVEQVEDAIEKELAGKFMLTYQKGKGPKLVSVIIPDNVVPGLRKLVEMREHVGVSEANLYVFAYTEHSLNHVSRWACVHEIGKLAGVRNLSQVTATKMRHQASTL